jgi:diguanylate cyclase (GGDEF)-like protein/PAS domain S-box-containing protein
VNDNIFVGLINNAALLLSLGLIYDILSSEKRTTVPVLNQITSGVIIGGMSIVLMLTPVRWESGIIFDTRTILLGVTGLFFGTIPTFLSMAIAGAYRLNLGGGGALMGVATIVSSGLIGLIWRRFRFSESKELSLRELYVFGGVVHATMILCMFLLPQAVILKAIGTLALPVIIVYPICSALLGILLVGRQRRRRIGKELLCLKDTLQQQNEELQINEEELRSQNDELLSTEEMLRVQINDYDTSQKLLKESEEKLRKLASEQRLILNSSSVGIIFAKNRRVLWANPAHCKMFGYDIDETINMNTSVYYVDMELYDYIGKNAYPFIATGGVFSEDVMMKKKDGTLFWCNLVGQAINPQNLEEGSIWSYLDISERKKAEEKINELAFYDQLTGLPNRTLLLDRLKQTMTATSRTGNYCALLFLDLDNFKTLNDTLGHEMGDLLLKEVAQRLTACVRAGDTSARMGGDEFVMILTNLSIDKRAAANQAEVVGEKIIAALNESYLLKDISYHNTPSIGATLFSGDQAEIEDLLKQADIAMYRAKDAGRNTIRFFDPDMEIIVKKRAALEKDLRIAINKNQFLLHYQAQMAGGKLTGSEVLVRWQHPERGIVSPADFIPLAEESRLILPLGQWVLETACRQLVQWAAHPDMSHLTVSVNVSAHQFHQADFVDQVLDVLNKTGANPQLLKLELTESLLVSKVEEIIEKMFALKVKGVGFSLDDFGTGYSSLSYLKRLPLDQLKIDQSFVRDVLTDSNDATIAKTVIVLGQSLGLNVIAEGVETAEQRDFLASSGCHAYQGYFFSKPLPLNSFEEYARKF